MGPFGPESWWEGAEESIFYLAKLLNIRSEPKRKGGKVEKDDERVVENDIVV